ncbi:ABC transporter permease [Streptacidiphilus fuscans]|uniref:ABC transporter permease n=1 Tax=Streptacidiphilus fuscans TaxID=2789292 RepID=A0A931B966_9ACTN|nr:ABC transporter permease [Streptacidiphilus fuscans]MBF9070073.1 ABC transporter permease [Streptacidiphilus fuscans]
MSALGRVVRSGVGRKRVQTLVMVLTTMTAVTACLLAAGLLLASRGPFDRAFDAQHGAHLALRFDGGSVDAAQLDATAHVQGVTATAGPYPAVTLHPAVGSDAFLPAGDPLPATTLVGRPIDGPLDDLRVTEGHWLTGPGQVVLPDGNSPLALGDRMTFPDLPGHPTLTVVGLAASVTGSADGWVSPDEIPALTAHGTVPDQQMLYRFADAGSATQLDADRAAVAAALPAGAVTAADSYLDARQAADKTSATFVPFLVAFGVLGLCMSVLVIGVVVSGAVAAGRRRIGVLKSLGFTPAQVVRAYLGTALIPAGVGAVLGVLFGNALAIPLMGVTNKALNSVSTGIPVWLDLVVPLATLVAVAGTALVPALRAGRLSTVEALTVGRGGQTRTTGRAVQQLLARWPLPRALSLGLSTPFARPGRALTVAAAVTLGTIGVTFGVGLAISLNGVQQGISQDNAGAVIILPGLPAPGSRPKVVTAADLARAADLINSEPGTSAWFSTTTDRLDLAGHTGQAQVVAYQGDSSFGELQLVSGSWFQAPGEAVAPSSFLTANGVHVGDTVTLGQGGRTARVRIVGEVLSLHDELLTDRSSLTPLGLDYLAGMSQFDIALKPGTDQASYADSLSRALAPYGMAAIPNSQPPSVVVLSMDTLASLLTLMLVAVAGLGVLNTVLLDTRERVHDLGVLKSLGMAPRQTVGMVLTSVSISGLAAGLVGVPIGIALHDSVLPAMARAAGTDVPGVDLAVYHAPELIPLVLGGLVLATLGALAPATWAARSRTATALRTE